MRYRGRRRSRCGRGDPRPPGGGEGGQVGYLQAAGRELVREPPRYRRVVLRTPWHTTVCGSVPAIASRRIVSRDAEPLRELRGGQEIRCVPNFGRLREPR